MRVGYGSWPTDTALLERACRDFPPTRLCFRGSRDHGYRVQRTRWQAVAASFASCQKSEPKAPVAWALWGVGLLFGLAGALCSALVSFAQPARLPPFRALRRWVAEQFRARIFCPAWRGRAPFDLNKSL
eukprot:4737391-Pyramimonas_sp.AAC.1